MQVRKMWYYSLVITFVAFIDLFITSLTIPYLSSSSTFSFDNQKSFWNVNYDIRTSTLEYFILSILRSGLLIGTFIGLWRRNEASLKRVKNAKFGVFLLATILSAGSLVKLLAYDELCEDANYANWQLWSAFVWNVVASAIMCVVWSYAVVPLALCEFLSYLLIH